MDIWSKEKRSKVMARIKSKHTNPELIIRSLVHRLGYRYRLHWKNLPGKPDLVFAKRRKVIFINGCFWHRHKNCKFAQIPKSNIEYWKIKFEQNQKRDARNQEKLKKLGWSILVLWECQIKNIEALRGKIKRFLH